MEDSNVNVNDIIEEYNRQVVKKDKIYQFFEYKDSKTDLKQ